MADLKHMFRNNGFQLEELSIEVSSRCASRCIHCSSGSSILAGDDMDPKFAKSLIRQAALLGATILSLSGGDPIIYPHTADLILYANEVGFPTVLVYTSGLGAVVLDENISFRTFRIQDVYSRNMIPAQAAGIALPEYMFWGDDFLDGTSVVPIYSLHSAYPLIHDYILGVKYAWVNAVEQLERLALDSGIDVEVHCVPMAPNVRTIADMDTLRNMLAGIGVSKMSLLRFVPQTRGKANRDTLELSKDMFVKLQHWVDVTQHDDHPVRVRIGCPFDYRHTLGMVDEKPKPCHAGHDLILVRPDGSVHPCAAWKTLTKANAHKQSLESIMTSSETFMLLRGYHKDAAHGLVNPKAMPTSCHQCSHFASCAGGCPAQRLHVAGSRDVRNIYSQYPDPMCPRVKYRS